MTLKDYRLVTLANHVVFEYLQNLVLSIWRNDIEYRELIIVNVGLKDHELQWLENSGCTIRDIDYKYYKDTMKHQSKDFADMMRERIQVVRSLCGENIPFVMMDTDTEILSNNFDLLDPSCDITYNTGEAPKGSSPHPDVCYDYHNLGVTFYHHPKNCIALIDEWERVSKDESYILTKGHSDQWWLYYAKESDIYKELKIQNLRARHYDCCQRDTYCECRTSIVHYIHYKGSERTFKARYKHFWEHNV